MACLKFIRNLFVSATTVVETEMESVAESSLAAVVEEEDKVIITESIKWEDTTKFTVPINGGQVIKVYDGDSITIAARLPMLGSPLYRFAVRLNGIDTPEIKGKNEDEKEAAKNARDALSAMILNKYITLRNVDTEKYGRILADVYIDEVHVNGWLIAEKFALPYDGGTKTQPKSWLAFKLTGVV